MVPDYKQSFIFCVDIIVDSVQAPAAEDGLKHQNENAEGHQKASDNFMITDKHCFLFLFNRKSMRQKIFCSDLNK